MPDRQDFTILPQGEQSPPNQDRIAYYLDVARNGQRPLRQLESALETAATVAIDPQVVDSLITRLAESGTLDYLGIHPDSTGDLACLLTWQALGSVEVQK